MTPDQIGPFLERVSLTDPRILPDDQAEALAATALWAVAMAEVDAQFALNAVAKHYAQSPYLVKPSDIAAQWRTHVRNRAERHVDPVPAADPEDPAAYNAELRASRAAAAANVIPLHGPRAALGPGRYETTALNYEEEDLGAMRLDGDLARMWTGVGQQAKDDNARRKALVLAHPDLAERIGKAPINIRPDAWTGYVPMEIGVNGINRSPIRRALAALVAEAEQRATVAPAPAATPDDASAAR
jgi:hypothetical protein